MSSKPTGERPRIRYRPGIPRPVAGPGIVGGVTTDPRAYDVTVELLENRPITEAEARAVELLLGSALRELLMAKA